MKLINHSLLIFSFLIGAPGWAQFLKEGTLTQFTSEGDYFAGGVQTRGAIYVIPNELNPEASFPILKRAVNGVYLSVGGERGLIGAIANSDISNLIQIDVVPEVAFYNQMNVVLLKIAADLPDFLHLRQAEALEWMRRASTANRLNFEEQILLSKPEFNSAYRLMESEARQRLTQGIYFKNSSYLKDPHLFRKAQTLAQEGRIQVLVGNLNDPSVLRAIAAQLTRRGLTISVCDLSNAWEVKYTGPSGVAKIVEALGPVLREDSIIMGTSVANCLADHLCFWNFHAFTVGLLQQLNGLEDDGTTMTSLFDLSSRRSSGGLRTTEALSRLKLIQLFLHDRQRPFSTRIRACSTLLSSSHSSLWRSEID